MRRNDLILLAFFALTLIAICVVSAISQLDLTENLKSLEMIQDVQSAEYSRESAEATVRVGQAQAHWTAIGAILSCISIVVTAAGLIFIAAQLQISQDQLHKDRAYIHFDGMKWLSFTKAGTNDAESWGIFPRWINSGVTPAINVSLWYAADWLPLEASPDFSNAPPAQNKTTMRPGGQFEMNPIFLGPSDVMRSGRAGTAYCLWGAAVYNDVFQKNKIRETRFCVKILGYGGDPAKGWERDTNPVDIHFAHSGENSAT